MKGSFRKEDDEGYIGCFSVINTGGNLKVLTYGFDKKYCAVGTSVSTYGSVISVLYFLRLKR